jgi:hypothetical protein
MASGRKSSDLGDGVIRAVSFSAFAVEFGPELQIPDSKSQKKGRKQPDFESGICNLESIPSANIGE